MRKTKLGCTILEGHDIADLPLVSENAEILEAEIERVDKKASNIIAGNIKLSDGTTVEEKFVAVEGDIEKAIDKADAAFQSASKGKILVARAITGKGVPTDPSDTFQNMANNIDAIETDPSIGTTDALAKDILLGKKVVSQGNLLTGTMPDNGAINNTITTQGGQIIVPEGYHNGSGIVKANFSNLYSWNIKDGVTVGGVSGTYKISKSNLRVETNFDRLVDDGGGYYTIPGATFIIAVYARGYYSDNIGCSVNDFNNGSKYATEMYRTGGSNKKGCFQIIDNNRLYDNGNMSFPLQDFLAIYI